MCRLHPNRRRRLVCQRDGTALQKTASEEQICTNILALARPKVQRQLQLEPELFHTVDIDRQKTKSLLQKRQSRRDKHARYEKLYRSEEHTSELQSQFHLVC